MPDLLEKQQEIENLRSSLNLLVTQKEGNMADSEVMAMSAMLDKLIVEYEQTRAQRRWKRSS